jgi:uncharacterized protein (DUF305 family)
MERAHPRAGATALMVAAAACATAPAAHAQADSGRPPYTAADVHFMSGMIDHHAQAVLMAGWAPTHGASAPVRILCERIVVGQRDEIALMQRWLRERHQTVPEGNPRGQMMPGMDTPMLMPGMLTPEQLAQLDSARGPAFDRLFLRDMIQHHRGAITMVNQLLATEGAAQDGIVFTFANGVFADQTTEIDRMNGMLDAMPLGGNRP